MLNVMNYHLYPVSLKKYSLILLYSFFTMALLAWYMEFYFEKLYGDLTRIGYFTERDFGWRSSQQVIPPEQLKDYSLSEADVLVIGDSFSRSHAWQARLIANDLKVCTLYWKNLPTHSLPDNLGIALRTSGFKGYYVIIESVERLLQKRLQTLSKEDNPIIKSDIVTSTPEGERERISLSKPNGVNWSINALRNTTKLSLTQPDIYLESPSIKAFKFDGCQLFSNRLCSYALFVNDDFTKKTFNAIDNVLIVNKKLQEVGIQPIWLIIPDKSTVYLGYGKYNEYIYQNIWQQFALHPALVAPDLGAEFVKKSRSIKDFYMPNDTHLSTNGYLYLGGIIMDEINNMKSRKNKLQ